MPRQIFAIHGGDTFNTYEEYLQFLRDWHIDLNRYRASRYDWKGNLAVELGPDYDVILPAMPNKINAKYLEWEIWFDKFVPFFTAQVILVGHSMGGIFLTKYLALHQLPVKVVGLFLVAAPFDEGDFGEPLADFVLPPNLSKVADQVDQIFLYHSQDDDVVPFANVQKYQEQWPEAVLRSFADRGHFNQKAFPEIIADIKSLN